MELSQCSLNSSRGWQKHMGGCGMGKLGNESRGLGWFYPVSKLRGLPAHLPRNLASFSPCVDDSNSGGSWPRRLGHHWQFLSYWRGGIRVLIVHLNSRWQRSYWSTCGTKHKKYKELDTCEKNEAGSILCLNYFQQIL